MRACDSSERAAQRPKDGWRISGRDVDQKDDGTWYATAAAGGDDVTPRLARPTRGAEASAGEKAASAEGGYHPPRWR